MRFKRVLFFSIGATFFIYSGLILSLFYFFDGALFLQTLFSERTLYSIGLSITAATFATLLSVIIGIPTAYTLSRFNFKGKDLIDSTLELPMIVSPAALGAMLLIFFNNPLGEWIQENTAGFIFTVYGIILAQFITTLGVAVRLIKTTMDEISPRYEDVARSLGATPFRAFFTTTLPLSKKGIIAASILTWAKALGEFGATITIGGSMAMKTETIPVAIFMRLSSADIEGTVVLILMLVTMGMSLLYITRLISRKSANA